MHDLLIHVLLSMLLPPYGSWHPSISSGLLGVSTLGILQQLQQATPAETRDQSFSRACFPGLPDE